MLTNFNFFNSNSFYYPWDFQTPATPIAHGNLVLHHELMVRLIFFLFLIFWNFVPTRVFAPEFSQTTNSIKPAFWAAHINTKGRKLLVRNFTTFRKPLVRAFSTSPEKKKSLKEHVNSMCLNFVQNTKKQQQKFLCGYAIGIISFAFFFFPIEVSGLALLLLLIIGLFSVTVVTLFEFCQKLKYFKAVSLVFGAAMITGLLYFQAYRVVIFYIIIFSLIVIKQTFFATKSVGGAKITVFFNDLSIIEGHFNKEFYMFNKLRQLNIFLTVFIVYSFVAILNGGLPTDLDFTDHAVFIGAVELLMLICLSNHLITLIIQWLIVDFCNSKTALVVTHKLGLALGGVGLAGLSITAVHLTSTTPGITPLPLPGVPWYQHQVLGFKAPTGAGIAYGQLHLALFDTMPPVDGTNTINLPATREAVSKALHFEASETALNMRNSILYGKLPVKPVTKPANTVAKALPTSLTEAVSIPEIPDTAEDTGDDWLTFFSSYLKK